MSRSVTKPEKHQYGVWPGGTGLAARWARIGVQANCLLFLLCPGTKGFVCTLVKQGTVPGETGLRLRSPPRGSTLQGPEYRPAAPAKERRGDGHGEEFRAGPRFGLFQHLCCWNLRTLVWFRLYPGRCGLDSESEPSGDPPHPVSSRSTSAERQ